LGDLGVFLLAKLSQNMKQKFENIELKWFLGISIAKNFIIIISIYSQISVLGFGQIAENMDQMLSISNL
jgi:lipid A disaccharide synthetase